MALSARQITLAATTATPLIVKGDGTGTTFKNTQGSLQDPIPVEIRNEDGAAIVFIGGPDVSNTKGQQLRAGESKVMNLYGEKEIPYAYSAGTPLVSVLLGRQ